MENNPKNIRALLEEIISGDFHKVRSSSCTIMKLSQNEECMKEIVPYLDEIQVKTANLKMGGLLAPNDRFVKKVIRILEHYKEQKECSCCLLSGEDNPNNYETIEIKEKVYVKDSNYMDYYVAECKKCNQKYKVYEREYHFTWWEWMKE